MEEAMLKHCITSILVIKGDGFCADGLQRQVEQVSDTVT